MAEPTLRKYKITGKGAKLNHNSEIKVEGDIIELSDMQAKEFAGMLTGVEPDSEAVLATPVASVAEVNLRDHERKELLTLRKTDLERELEKTNKGLAEIEERETAAKAKVVKPAVAPVAPVPQAEPEKK